jgi:hypothetical protein
MAGLIARLFGGQTRPPDTEPAPGLGGVSLPPGPAGQSGFPGSTSSTRTFKGRNPRGLRGNWTEIKQDTNTGARVELGTTPEIRQQSYRGDIPPQGGIERRITSARATPLIVAPQTGIRQEMQHNHPSEFFGGPALHTRPGNNTAGGEPGSRSAAAGGHNARDTTTPWSHAGVIISGGVPGSQNVRNEIAQRYKNAPGQSHTYRSAARADQAGVNPSGQASDGNVHPERATEPVTVQNRFVMNPGGGVLTWSVQREMPYGGRGDGARGADLNGHRYYAQGQTDQFFNAGQGDYGIERSRGSGNKRPVSFTEPAPWTAQFYDTTDGVENQSMEQAPNMVYVSPATGRASNSTGRTG